MFKDMYSHCHKIRWFLETYFFSNYSGVHYLVAMNIVFLVISPRCFRNYCRYRNKWYFIWKSQASAHNDETPFYVYCPLVNKRSWIKLVLKTNIYHLIVRFATERCLEDLCKYLGYLSLLSNHLLDCSKKYRQLFRGFFW